MTIEAYLQGLIPSFPFTQQQLETAVLSPKMAGLQPLSLTDDWETVTDDEGLLKSLKYASATLLYSASNTVSGGSRTEQVGDVRASVSDYNFTWLDRYGWRLRADALRTELGIAPEADLTSGGAFDGGYLRTPSARRTKGGSGCY